MIVRKQTIRFSPDRTPMPKRVKIGFEGDNMVERLEFVLPDIAESQTATMMMDGEYANMAALSRSEQDDRYYLDLTAERVGMPGEAECFIVIDGENGEAWSSGTFRMTTGSVPDVNEELIERYPDAIEQMRADIAAHRAEMERQEEAMEQASGRAQNHAAGAAESAEQAAQSAQRADAAADIAKGAEDTAVRASVAANEAVDALNSPDIDVVMEAPEANAAGAWDTTGVTPVLKLNIPRGLKGDPGEDAPQIDDGQISDAHPWSSRNIVERLCPEFERSGGAVYCHPVEGYPMNAVSRIEGSLIGDGGVAPENPYLLTGWDRIGLYHGGKNLLDVSLATADEDAPDTLNGAVIEGGMVDISQQMSLAALTIPMKVKRGVWYDVWCRMQVYDRELPANSGGTIQLYLEPNATQWWGNEETMLEEGEMTLHAQFILTEEDIKEQAAINIRMVTPFPAKLRLWPMAMISVDGVQKSATEFEPYRGRKHIAELGQGVHKGSFNWQTGELTTEWEHRVLDGTEDWKEFRSAIPGRNYYYLILGAKNVYVNGNNGGVICSHWPQREILTTTENNGVHLHNSDTDGGQDRLIFRPDMSAYDTLGKWKAFLTAKYEAGHPVVVAYQRREPMITQLPGREFVGMDGENCLYSLTGGTTVSGRENPAGLIGALEQRIAALEAASEG